MNRILVVDDNIDTRDNIAELFTEIGYSVDTAGDGKTALDKINEKEPDCVILDLNLPILDGWEVLKSLKPKLEAGLIVIVITAFGEIESAVRAVKMGAYYFIEKPFNNNVLQVNVERGLNTQKVKKELKNLRLYLGDTKKTEDILGISDSAKSLIHQIEIVAPTDYTVLITGETGTGKEVVANLLHNKSNRASQPFVPVDCGAIPESLIESELFGHERGSFTGAFERKTGKFKQADKGTLFLDEIGNLPIQQQQRLLRVVQFKQVTPIGSKKDFLVDTRLIFATKEDLQKEVDAGRFREDLFYRINGYQINIPPLRSRADDIPMFVEKFIQSTSAELGREIDGITNEAMDVLIHYNWPGNIRQLKNVIRNAMLHTHDMIQIEHLNLPISQIKKKPRNEVLTDTLDTSNNYNEAYQKLKDDIEKELVQRALSQANNNVSQAARLFGINRKSFYEKMKRLDISVSRGFED